MTAPTKHRAHYLPSVNYFNLNQACAVVNKAFEPGFGCYLVGSSLQRRDYRDVDVRCILRDEQYDSLFRTAEGNDNALWSMLCTTITLWLTQQSGLPIDFQLQRQTDANAKHGGLHRNPLGIFLDYPGERPTDI